MEYQFGFERLRVWQFSRKFVKQIYDITATFPKEEKYSLVDQIRRATVSVASNIAEGSARISNKDQAHFTSLAFGSLMEVLNQLYLSLDLGYINEEIFLDLKGKVSEISNLLNALRKTQLSGS